MFLCLYFENSLPLDINKQIYLKKRFWYLNCIVNIPFLFLQTRLRWTFIRKVFQLAHASSVLVRTHIDGHAVWFHEALDTATSFIGYFLSFYHVTRKYFPIYWFLEHQDAIVSCRIHCRKETQWNSLWTGSLFGEKIACEQAFGRAGN